MPKSAKCKTIVYQIEQEVFLLLFCGKILLQGENERRRALLREKALIREQEEAIKQEEILEEEESEEESSEEESDESEEDIMPRMKPVFIEKCFFKVI